MDQLTTIFHQHPRSSQSAPGTAELLAALVECSMVCRVCADACANEVDANLGWCIRSDLDCADTCWVTATLLTRQPLLGGALLARQLTTCAEMCRRCAADCRDHADLDHCATCADTCDRCAELCEQVAGQLRTNATS